MRGTRCMKQLVEHSKRSYIAAIDTYNRIGSICRIEGFTYYMTNAWELLLKAHMIQMTGDVKNIYTKKTRGGRPETKSLDDCLKYVFQNEVDPIRRNIEWISEIRNQAVHFMVTELESIFISYFQASAINYSNCINEWFAISINEEYDFPILSLFTLSTNKTIDVKKLKGKYDKQIIEYVVEQQIQDREIRSSNIDNSKAQMYIPIEYKAAIVKNVSNADMLFINSPDGSTSLLYVETPKDVEKTHPYVHADLQVRLCELFEETVFPTKKFSTHDAKCVTYVNKLNEDQRYVYRMSKPVVIRYSELYLNFVAGNIEKDKEYLFKMRERYRKSTAKR